MSEETKIAVPILVLDGFKKLRISNPVIAKKLSWHDMDVLTKPLRQRIKELETQLETEISDAWNRI